MMRKMVVGFSRNSGPLSYVIRWCIGKGGGLAPASHCFTVHEVPWSRVDGSFMVSQAAKLNVHYVYSDHFLAHNTVTDVYEVMVPIPQYASAESLRVRLAGVPYGFLQLLGYLWVILLSRIRRRTLEFSVHNPAADGDRSMVCVEYVMRQLGLASSETWNPEDLRGWCERHGRRVEIKEYLTASTTPARVRTSPTTKEKQE